MTEEEIRRIVREEVEHEALKVDGIYDHCRTVAFGMLRSVLEMLAANTFEAFRQTSRSKSDGGTDNPTDDEPEDRWGYETPEKPH